MLPESTESRVFCPYLGCVASGLDGVGCVEGAGLEWHVEEVTTHDVREVRHILLHGGRAQSIIVRVNV